MIRRFRMALILALALFESAGAQARMGSISGRLQTQDGSPAAGVRVAAMNAGDLIAFTLTDNAGRYRIDDVPPGRYLIAAGRIGSFTYLPGTADENKATTISVMAGSATENLNFKLATAAGVRIRGVVGIPAGNFPRARQATLSGRPQDSQQTIELESVVREDGSFEFRGIMPGTYTVEFTPTGQELHLTVADANIDNIKVKAPTVIAGSIRVEDGGPVLTSPSQVNAAATFLTIATMPSDGSGYTYHPVAGNGTFAFTLPPETTHGIEVYDLPFGYYVKSIRSGARDVIAAKGLTLDDSALARELVIVLTKQRPVTETAGVTVRGRVSTLTIPPDFQVSLTMTPPLYNAATRVESDGSFTFHDVPQGIYSAHFLLAGFMMSVPVVVGSSNIDDVKLSLPAAVSLKGRVRLENNATPLPPFSMRFSRSSGQFFIATARDGTFSVNLLEGDYRIAFTSLPARYVLQSVNHASKDARFDMAIDASKALEELVITLRDNEAR